MIMLNEDFWIKICCLMTCTNWFLYVRAKVITQSMECSAKDLENKLQCFREIPKERYESIVNDTVVMRCTVENQHGRVQWRAQKMTMGFDRSIPAMPRFRITGDASKSEYFLTIHPTQLSDNGDYECQVEPIKHHPLLRRRTHLFVYRKPTLPQIWFRSRDVSSTSILIDPQQNCFSLNCYSYHGIPAPTFSWKVKDKLLSNFKCKEHSETRMVYVDERNYSNLSIHPTELFDMEWVECHVSNQALKIDSGQSFLMTRVQIRFQKRPGKPQTKSNNLTLSDRGQLKIPCSISPPGLPKAHLTWKWSEESLKVIPMRFVNLNPYISTTTEKTRILSILNIPSVVTEMHVTMLRCESVYTDHQVNSASVFVLVKHLPKRLDIFLAEGPLLASSDQKDFAIYQVKEGEIYVFKCKTSLYYGDYELSWQFRQNYKKTTQFSNFQVKNRRERMDQFFYSQVSTLEMVANRTMHNVILLCSVGHAPGLSASIHMDVLYLPREVAIFSSYPNYESYLTIGDTIEVNCSIQNGNPVPDLIMFLDSAIIERTQLLRTEISVKIKIERKHDQSKIYCLAKSQYFHSSIKSRVIKLNLALLPRQILLNFQTPQNGVVESGQRQTLTCTVIGSNPEPFITWRLRLCQKMTKPLTDMKENCQLQDIKTVFSNFSFINSKESQLTSFMTWQPTWLYHKSTIICKVTNYLFPKKIFQKNLEINVIFSPKIFIYPMERKLKITKGDNKTFVIDVASNPALQSFLCLKCSGTLLFVQNIRPFYSKWLFSIQKAETRHQGSQFLVASNPVGSANHTIYIEITTSTTHARIESRRIYLSLQSNALTYTPPADIVSGNVSFSWSFRRDDSQTNETILKCNQGLYNTNNTYRYLKLFVKCNGDKFTSLVFYYINQGDSGKYYCNVSLDKRLVMSTEYVSVILDKPSIVKDESVNKFGCDLLSSCLLSCFFTNIGRAKIEWYREDNGTVYLNTSSIISNLSQSFESNFRIPNVSEDHYGEYFCKISNEIGSDSWPIIVKKPSSPDKPLVCSVNSIGKSQVKVSWKPGFNGGRPEIFKIQWTTDHGTERTWSTDYINPANRSEKLSYLIKDLGSNMTVTVRVRASNLFGESKFCSTSFHIAVSSSTSLSSLKPPDDQQYLKVLAYTLAVCSVSILLIVLITGFQKISNILRDRRSAQNKSMNRFISLNNRLYSSMIENDKDISMIFSNRSPTSPSKSQSRRNPSGNTSLMNISDHS